MKPDENVKGAALPPAAQRYLQSCANMRAAMAQGRQLFSDYKERGLDFDSYERRLDEIEALVRRGTREDWLRVKELHEALSLDMEADTAASIGGATERLVRFTDQVAQRVEEKKFELSSEARDDLDEVLEPYKDGIREKMLGILPIETRRRLEDEKRRLEEG